MPKKSDTWNGAITDDTPSEERVVRELYDDFSSQYDSVLSQWGYQAPDVVANYLTKTVSLKQTVLDAGCGTGLTGAALARQGYSNVIGTDLSPDSVNVARKTGLYKDVRVLNLNDPLPFHAGQFGGAICVGVLSYIPNPEPVLKELLRVLAPGGTLVFTQREDLFKQLNSTELFERLQATEGFDRLVQSEPELYLPNNPSFTDVIGVHYIVWQKHA